MGFFKNLDKHLPLILTFVFLSSILLFFVPPRPQDPPTVPIEDEDLLELPERSNGNYRDSPPCDLFDGRWILDRDAKPSYEPGSCPFVGPSFDCFKNGRPDTDYMKLRWKPNACMMPRLEGRRMLEMLRGKRLAFVGDSLNRNMWESLGCILRDSLADKKQILEFRAGGFYAFRFMDYNCTIEFFQAQFLVQKWLTLSPNGTKKETLLLDRMDKSSASYREADVIVFNSVHWWTPSKTSNGKNYYQEGDHVYSQLSATEAYLKAMRTWARWVDSSIDPNRTRVFFRGYSSTHYHGGKWNSGGKCKDKRLPIAKASYLGQYPKMMVILESVMEKMATPVFYMNVTRMTAYRSDAHPSVFRVPAAERIPGEKQEDCSHWCLPGVPDAWNEILYTMLLREQNDNTRNTY